MTINSIVIQKLLSTNAHLGRRVAAHHFKVYICGSRNGIAILDSDKTLICLRNACHFIGSPIRQKGRSFFVNTNSLFDEIVEKMATRIGCINDSQWRIGGFLTNCSSPKKIRSRNKKINFGSNQQPDCVVIIDADRKSSVILEADRLQIPIASLVDSNIPLGSYKRITYPIPANDPIQLVYLFRNSITKTVLLERGRIVAMKETAGEERTHRPELLKALLDKGGLTNERKMELVPHPGRKPHFLATNPFRNNYKIKQIFYKLLFLATIIFYSYVFCLKFEFIGYFQALLEKIALFLGGHALSLFIKKIIGCSGRVALLVSFASKSLTHLFYGQDVSLFMNAPALEAPALPEWEQALRLPDNLAAPQPLRSHIEEELRVLCGIGRKNTLSESSFSRFIEPLALDTARVGFYRFLLQRIDALQRQHFNGGEPILFSIYKDREELYSVMWEYAEKLEREGGL